jgi:hypothetical protein
MGTQAIGKGDHGGTCKRARMRSDDGCYTPKVAGARLTYHAPHARLCRGNPKSAQRLAAASSHLTLREHASCFLRLARCSYCRAALPHIAPPGITPTLALNHKSHALTSNRNSQFCRIAVIFPSSAASYSWLLFFYVQNNVDQSPNDLLSNHTCALKCRLLTRCSMGKCLNPPHSHFCYSPFTVPIRLSRAYLDTGKPR